MGQAQKSHLPSISMIAPSLQTIPYKKVQHIHTEASALSKSLPSTCSWAWLVQRPSMAINRTAHDRKPDLWVRTTLKLSWGGKMDESQGTGAKHLHSKTNTKYSLEYQYLIQIPTCSVGIEYSLSRERQEATASCAAMSALHASLKNSLSGIQNCAETKQGSRRSSEPDNAAYRQQTFLQERTKSVSKKKAEASLICIHLLKADCSQCREPPI